jgi:hypothetical protein
MNGIFVSNWTTNGDLSGAMHLINPSIVFYRLGLFSSGRYVFDDIDRVYRYDKIAIPVIIFQPQADDEALLDIVIKMFYSVSMPIAIDVEINDKNLVSRVSVYIQTIKTFTSMRPFIYTNLDFIARYNMSKHNVFNTTPLWLAYYGKQLPLLNWGGGIVVWQSAPKWEFNKRLTFNVTKEEVLDNTFFGLHGG